MTQQPKSGPLSPAVVWANGMSARPLPAHTVAQSDRARDLASRKPKVTLALLKRGRERYDIYCSPCHGLAGRGDGMIVHRGFPPPPDYDSPRLRAVQADHFFDVITNGYGIMYSYAGRVPPADRWAIAAYIRALQVSASMPASRILASGEAKP